MCDETSLSVYNLNLMVSKNNSTSVSPSAQTFMSVNVLENTDSMGIFMRYSKYCRNKYTVSLFHCVMCSQISFRQSERPSITSI